MQVMHGAKQDIEWLLRDFGIRVDNLFDTEKVSDVCFCENVKNLDWACAVCVCIGVTAKCTLLFGKVSLFLSDVS